MRTSVTGTGTALGGTTSCTVNTPCPVTTPNASGTGSTQTWVDATYTGPPSEILNLCHSTTPADDGSHGGTLVLCNASSYQE